LSDLDRAGAVKVLGSGRTKLFELNRDHPIGIALQALFTAERAWLEDTVTVLAGIAKEVAIAAWLFGSVAHCEDTVDSDLDLAVVMAQPQASFEAAADEVRDRFRVAGDKMGFTINTSPISLNDVRRLATARTALWNELVTNGRLIYGPRPEDLARRLNAGMVQERSDGQNRHNQGG
jgi:predicted nucleotidyltransferase